MILTLLFIGEKQADGTYRGTFMLANNERVPGTLEVTTSVDQPLPDELYCSFRQAVKP